MEVTFQAIQYRVVSFLGKLGGLNKAVVPNIAAMESTQRFCSLLASTSVCNHVVSLSNLFILVVRVCPARNLNSALGMIEIELS